MWYKCGRSYQAYQRVVLFTLTHHHPRKTSLVAVPGYTFPSPTLAGERRQAKTLTGASIHPSPPLGGSRLGSFIILTASKVPIFKSCLQRLEQHRIISFYNDQRLRRGVLFIIGSVVLFLNWPLQILFDLIWLLCCRKRNLTAVTEADTSQLTTSFPN